MGRDEPQREKLPPKSFGVARTKSRNKLFRFARPGGVMKKWCRALLLLIVSMGAASISFGATVTGTVKGPEGSAFKGAFVQAQNTGTRVLISVLSDKDGHYKI